MICGEHHDYDPNCATCVRAEPIAPDYRTALDTALQVTESRHTELAN